MSTTRTDLIARCRSLLQDVDIRAHVWPTEVLGLFCDQGLRRLNPFVPTRAAVAVTADSTTKSWVLNTLLTSAYGVEVVYSDENLEWEIYGGSVVFQTAPTLDFVVRVVVAYVSIDVLPDVLADVVGDYACSEALTWLVNRGGEALSRYLSGQGQMSSEEVLATAQHYHEQFLTGRDENAVSTLARL